MIVKGDAEMIKDINIINELKRERREVAKEIEEFVYKVYAKDKVINKDKFKSSYEAIVRIDKLITILEKVKNETL